MAKKQRQPAQPNPAIRLSGLRPRLAQLFVSAPEAPALRAELDRLTDGLKPASYLPVLVSAYTDTPQADRAQLAEPLGVWLRAGGRLAALREVAARQAFEAPAHEYVSAWLEAGGLAPVAAPALAAADLFIEAYEVGDASQASVTLFWYEDPRRRRVIAASFLIDYEPPWEGSLKDLAYLSFRDIGRAHEEYFASWRTAGLHQRPIGLTDAMGQVWATLRQSQAQGIRLPADFIKVMFDVVPMLLGLPSDPDSPALSIEELMELATKGRSPEDLRRDEQLLGFQKRMPDGSILRILRPLDDDDW